MGILGKNNLRFLNHSHRPNAAFSDDARLYAMRGIRPAEEITFDYGEDWSDVP